MVDLLDHLWWFQLYRGHVLSLGRLASRVAHTLTGRIGANPSSCDRFPYYYTVKTAFIVWLMLPSTRGANVIYNKAIKPAMSSGHRTTTSTSATAAAPAQ